MKRRIKLGDLLISLGEITPEQLNEALKTQKITKKKIGEILIEKGYISEYDLIKTLEEQLGIPHIHLENYRVNMKSVKLISQKLAKKHIVIPIQLKDEKLVLAMADPLDIVAIDDVKMMTNLNIEPVISTISSILNAIERYYQSDISENNKKNKIETIKKENIYNTIFDDIKHSPIVKLVNTLIKQAIRLKASDIHIEPVDNVVRMRYRIDGDLHEIMKSSITSHSAIITRIKIIGNMDIAEKRLPQDGRIEMNYEDVQVDLRISTIPTVFGEKAVIRLLDRNSFLLKKEQLGFSGYNLRLFSKALKSPNGIILVTGPTGSGKTTTLYAGLSELNTIHKNIITIEDPVEYHLKGINQIQVNKRAGLDFAKGLRAILRQDPDIIMIGEIRDDETAKIAVRAAITGHLVISTIHTNDAPSTIARLKDMGIAPYLISSSIIVIIAQRLVKKLCNRCKQEYKSSKQEQQILDIDESITLYKANGCGFCNKSGYEGRTAIHEIMPLNDNIKNIINNNVNVTKIKEKAVKNGMKTLKDSCVQLVIEGITTMDELEKIIFNL